MMAMPTRSLIAAGCLVISAAAASVASAPPAHADCIEVEAGYHVLGGGRQALPGACVPTPFTMCLTVSREVGDPNVVMVDVTGKLTCPV